MQARIRSSQEEQAAHVEALYFIGTGLTGTGSAAAPLSLNPVVPSSPERSMLAGNWAI